MKEKKLEIDNMYGRINKAFHDKPDAANVLVEALQTVRIACKAENKAIELVEREIESLIKLQATKRFVIRFKAISTIN